MHDDARRNDVQRCFIYTRRVISHGDQFLSMACCIFAFVLSSSKRVNVDSLLPCDNEVTCARLCREWANNEKLCVHSYDKATDIIFV